MVSRFESTPPRLLAYPVPIVDGNSPGVWVDGTLHVYTSTGDPLAMSGADLFNLRQRRVARGHSQGSLPDLDRVRLAG